MYQLTLNRTLDKKWAVASVLLAQLVFGLVPILIRFCQREIDTNAVIFDRFCVAVLFLLFWDGLIAVRRRLFDSPAIEPKAIEQKPSITSLWGLLCLASFFLSSSTILWAWSLTQTSIANSTLMYSTLPLFTVLMGWLLFGKSVDRIFLIGMAVTMAGSFIIGLDDFQLSLDKLQGDFFALLAAMIRTGYILTVEKLRHHLNAITIVKRVSMICILLNLPLLFTIQGKFLPYSGNGWLTMIGLGLTLIVAQGLMSYSFKQLSSGFVAIVSCIDPIFSAVFSWLVFSETMNFYNLVGFVVILLGVCLASYSKSIDKESKLLDSDFSLVRKNHLEEQNLGSMN
jgi:drug/metabolite transporter (DMT)-like permease